MLADVSVLHSGGCACVKIHNLDLVSIESLGEENHNQKSFAQVNMLE